MPDIAIWASCDHRCNICSNPRDFAKTNDKYSIDKIIMKVNGFKYWSKNNFYRFTDTNDWIITWWEPTLNPDYLEIINYIHKEFPLSKITQLSHWDKFSDIVFTKKVLKINNLHLCFPIHWYNSETHDRITWKYWSFSMLINWISNVLKFKNPTQTLELRIVIQKINALYLEKIFILINKYLSGIDFITLVFIEYEWQAIENLEEIKISYKDFFNNNELLLLKRSNIFLDKLRLYHFPLCVFSDYRLWKNTWRTLDVNEIMYWDKCSFCIVKKYCMWFHDSYFNTIWSSDELKPLSVDDIKTIKILESKDNFKYKPFFNVEINL